MQRFPDANHDFLAKTSMSNKGASAIRALKDSGKFDLQPEALMHLPVSTNFYYFSGQGEWTGLRLAVHCYDINV